MTRSPLSEPSPLSIPWSGVRTLARHYAGKGSLLDWLSPPDWDMPRAWTLNTVRARASYAFLLHLNQVIPPDMPKYDVEWLNLLEQEILRASEVADVPSDYTDWEATLATYGRYPSERYIERIPRGTFDTPLTRTLKWFCGHVNRAVQLSKRVLDQEPLAARIGASLQAAFDLGEVQGAADMEQLDGRDAEICEGMGGIWSFIARTSAHLNILFYGNVRSQSFALASILPTDSSLRGKLFEVANLGVAASAIHNVEPMASWVASTPIGAFQQGNPCLRASLGNGIVTFHYQIVPQVYRPTSGPYRTLATAFGDDTNAILRPDIWLVLDVPIAATELLIECKHSAEPGYIRNGVSQVLAYLSEYPPRSGVRRIHMVVCPEEIIEQARSWEGSDGVVVLGTPVHLDLLVTAIVEDRAAGLLASWRSLPSP